VRHALNFAGLNEVMMKETEFEILDDQTSIAVYVILITLLQELNTQFDINTSNPHQNAAHHPQFQHIPAQRVWQGMCRQTPHLYLTRKA